MLTKKEKYNLETSNAYDNLIRKKLTRQERAKIYGQYNGHCAYCGVEIEFKDMQVDHIHPLRKGGKDELENMICACRSCNHYKSTLTIEQFRKELSKMPNRLVRDSVTFKNSLRYGLVEIKEKPIMFYFEKQGDDMNV